LRRSLLRERHQARHHFFRPAADLSPRCTAIEASARRSAPALPVAVSRWVKSGLPIAATIALVFAMADTAGSPH
jgi:hypothetical protein